MRNAKPDCRRAATGVRHRDGEHCSLTNIAAASLVDVTAGSTTNGIVFQMPQASTFSVSGIVVDREGRNGRFSLAAPDGVYLAAASVPVVVATGTGRSAAVNIRTGGPGSVKVTVEGRQYLT